MNLPNVLTVSRVLLTIAFVFFLTKTGLLPVVIAAGLFLVASFTDYYDGYYAKKHNLISDFGKIMDPIADKFLILAAFYVFMRMHIIAEWMFVLIFAREFLVTGSRVFAMKRGRVIAAERAGKYKTVLQIFTISVILIYIMMQEAGLFAHLDEISRKGSLQVWGMGINVLMLATVALTLISGGSYLWNNRKSFLLNNLV